MVTSFSNPVHVDEMVEENHSFFSWHRSQSSLEGFRHSYFIKKQMAVLFFFHQTIPVIP
jgi:hypothetical protein